jgi:hypothetical protein
VATRRKYRSRPDPIPADNGAAAAAQASPVAPGQAAGGDDSPLLAALRSQQHAEHLQHLQRQHATRAQVGLPEPPLDPATRQAVDQHIDAMPGLSDHKKRFLKSHPSLLQQPHLQLMSHAYQIALHAGIPDDTPAMDAAVLGGIHLNLQHHRQLSQLTSAHAQPTPENHQAHHDTAEAVAALQREAEQHLAAHQPASPTAPKPQRRSLPMSAPVSRDVPSASGHRQPDGWNTLSAEERQIARNSFTDPNVSNEQKELMYLRQKQKLHRMRQDGSYSEQRG